MPTRGEQYLERIGDPPETFDGSSLEWIVYNVLIALDRVPGIDFAHQYVFDGGRLVRGGLVADFYFFNERAVWLVQGTYYHYRTRSLTATAQIQAAAFLRHGITTVIFIDEEDVLEDPFYIVREALLGFSHSRVDVV